MKKREEAWVKLEEAAKRNPTFNELADTLPSSDFEQYGGHFAMIDEEALAGGDEELLDELAAFEATKPCDTQVMSLCFVICKSYQLSFAADTS